MDYAQYAGSIFIHLISLAIARNKTQRNQAGLACASMVVLAMWSHLALDSKGPHQSDSLSPNRTTWMLSAELVGKWGI